MDRLPRRSGSDFSCDCRCSVTADTDGHWSSGQGGKSGRLKGAGKLDNQTQQACSRCGKTDHTSANCFTLTKRAENVERLVICVDPLELLSPRPRTVRKAKEAARVRMLPGHVGIVVRMDTCRRSVPRRRIHSVAESTTASQAGSSQDTIMVGSVGSCFDVGSVSEVTFEPRGADGKICSMDAPNVREGESVDIEIDSGAEVSCFPANIGEDTYPLHETRLSMCGGHHVAAGGGKLHGVGGCNRARRCCELVGTIQSHEHWQGTLVNTRSEPLWLGDGLPC